MTEKLYRQLADALNSLPEGFPPTPDNSHLRILEYLFTPEEAETAIHLTLIPEEALSLITNTVFLLWTLLLRFHKIRTLTE